MKRKSLQGVAIMEFALAMLVMVPLLLGTIGCGLQLIQSMQTIQLARDAGRMYARGLDFSQAGNKTILAALGSDVGLKTNGTGSAVMILSTVVYIDKGMCLTAGKPVDAGGNPIGCPNYKKWVFAQRIVVGNVNFRTSNLGGPLTTGPDPVLVDATTGKISLDDQVNNAGDVAAFAAIGNPFVSLADSGTLDTLPSGQVLYVTEAGTLGFTMKPFALGGGMYAYSVF